MRVANLLELRNIVKVFPGVLALKDMNFDLRKGEVHVLVGENGAGKSTLIKIISGAYQPDRGEILLEGEPVTFQTSKKAQELGIATIYQEFNLIPELTVAQNIFLGREPKKLQNFAIDWSKLYDDAAAIIKTLGVAINPRSLICELSVSQQQMVEIAKALSLKAKLIIFDEPTGTLGAKDIKNIFNIIRMLKDRGVGIIYISHRLEEIFEIGDRVTILRDGQFIKTIPVADLNLDEMIVAMVGREVKNKYPRTYNNFCQEMLRVENLSRDDLFEDISFTVRKGEIVGFSGLVGAGRTEVMRAIFGIDKPSGGTILVNGQKYEPSPLNALKAGIAFIPEDRKREGLCLKLSVKHNIVHAAMPMLFPWRVIGAAKEKECGERSVRDLAIKTPGLDQQVQYLSGGNQQKVILAKWLLTKAKIFIFDEPTRGIDVGAKAEFHKLMNDLVAGGAAVIMVSSEMPEILGMSDRIYVMREGRIAAEFTKEEATQEKILARAMK